jgi:UDP-GlcNAc:undecaprenyl-phosphate GlcNAc-1-phosphate transferase
MMLQDSIQPLTHATFDALAPKAPEVGLTIKALDLVNGYAPIFFLAFLTTLVATPLVRRVAVALEIIDKPDRTRKQHLFPIAYLGGFAVFLGVIAGITYSLSITRGSASNLAGVPISVIIGLLAITFTGLADDAFGWDPRLKIAGQLVAAAALAVQEIGTKVAQGALEQLPFMGQPNEVLLNIGSFALLNGHVYYWVGTALIAIFVLGGCNAANFIDGLDGLLSGTVAIMMIGFLAVSIMMASAFTITDPDTSLVGARIVICLATLGAVLGFLPWNWNPAVIFLGDCGSLQLGYLSVVVILMFGEQGHTHLVLAGLIIFALPIMDAALAILRRKLAGVPFSTPDSNHIHHLVKRATGGVKSAVVVLYLIAAAFSAIGATLAALVAYKVLRLQIGYAVAFVLFGFVGAIALKSARRQQWDAAAASAAKSEPVPAKAEPGRAPVESSR